MTDVARLGLEVRSEQVAKGASDLDKLTNAAKRAEAAASGVSATTKNAGAAAVSLSASAGKAAAALNNEAVAARKAAEATRAHASAVNDNVVRVNRMGGSMSGLAAQFQDIGVTASMGMNPLIVGLQQGTQIAGQMEAAIQGGSSAVSVLGNAFKSLFQPLTFISIGLTVLAAAGLQMVDWVSVGEAALNGMADALEVVGPYATMAAAGLALLYAPAILGGIKAVTVGILGMAKAAGAAALAFAAANPATAFVLGLVAAVAAMNVFRKELAEIFGRDIVEDAKSAVNTVIAVFHGGYEGIVGAWGLLPDAFKELAMRAGWYLADTIRYWVNEAILLVDGFIGTLNEKMGTSIGRLSTLAPIAPPKSSGAAGKAGEIISGAINERMGTDYIGGAYDLIAKGASAASDKLRELAGSLGETEKAKKRAKTEAEKLAEKYNDILLDAEGFIAAQMAEKDALLLTEEAANALRYEQELLNKAMQAGITIDAAKAAEIKSYAAAMAGAEAETSRFREALNFAKDLTKGFVSDLRSGLEQGKGFWRSFGDAAMNVLDKIVDKLLNNVIDALFQVNSFGGSGGLFGIIGSLFGFAKGGVFNQSGVTAFAKGGVVNTPTVFPFAKGIGLMGEAGPEAIMPLRRGADGRLGVSAPRSAANDQPMRLEIVSRFDADGGFESAVERSSRPVAMQESAKAAGQVARAVPSMALGAMDNSRTRRTRTISPGGGL